MTGKNEPSLELLWYWEGIVSRYYFPSREWRSSREVTFWYLRKGSVELLWKNGRKKVKAGHWIMPTPLLRNERFSADAEIQSLRFNAFSADGRMLLCPAHPLVIPHRKDAPLIRHLQAIRRLLGEELKQDLGYKVMLDEMNLTLRFQLKIRACMAEWFGSVLDEIDAHGGQPLADVEQHPAIVAAMQYLAQRNLRTPLREKNLAEQVGLSLPHLRRLFRKQVGFTIKNWDSKRLESSVKYALRNGQWNCKEIAREHGFSSASHFSRWFRETFFCSPQEWRRKKVGDDIV